MRRQRLQPNTGRTTAGLLLTLAGISVQAWCQPAEPKDENETKGKARTKTQQMRVIVTTQGPDGEVQVLDGTGKPLAATKLGAPRLLASPANRQQGSLAVTDKYVYVLLNGLLYQYDPDTLELLKHVRVSPPKQTDRTVRKPKKGKR